MNNHFDWTNISNISNISNHSNHSDWMYLLLNQLKVFQKTIKKYKSNVNCTHFIVIYYYYFINSIINSFKTKNKLAMFLSIGTLIVSLGCLTYFLIHHFTSTKDDGEMKDIIKSTYQYIGDSFVNKERGSSPGPQKIDDFVVDPKTVYDGLALVKHHKITLDELRQHAKTIKTDLPTIMELHSSWELNKLSEFEKYIDDFSKEIYWLTPILDKYIIKDMKRMLKNVK